jgi:hypothetical protein
VAGEQCVGVFVKSFAVKESRVGCGGKEGEMWRKRSSDVGEVGRTMRYW